MIPKALPRGSVGRERPQESYSQEASQEVVSFLGVGGVARPAGLGAEGGRADGWEFKDVWMEGGNWGRVAGNRFS